MEISEHTAKFSSSQFEVQSLELGETGIAEVEFAVVKEEFFDQQDGTKKQKSVLKVIDFKPKF